MEKNHNVLSRMAKTPRELSVFSAIIQVNIEVDGHKTRENILM